MSIEISTRREMAETLDAVMTSSYGSLVDELRLARGHSLLKTYIFEAHASGSISHDGILTLLRAFFERAKRVPTQSVEVSETHEEKLFRIRGASRRDQFMFYIDAADTRFWVAHALAKSEVSDAQVELLLKLNQELDSAWMPAELLQKIQGLGESRGLGLDFDRRYLDAPIRRGSATSPSDRTRSQDSASELRGITTAKHFEYVKMQLWGAGTERILDAFNNAGLRNSTTVSKVRLKTVSNEDSALFSLADVKYDGKITGRGTSFDVYNGLLLEILKRYSNAVRTTEKKFKLAWIKGGAGARLQGEPIYIKLGEGIDNLEHFCLKIFSGEEPFRLLGRPVRRNSNFYTVSAIDLHINQRVDFEISHSTMSIFLPRTTCGNSVLRLYTNLQHFLTSDVKAIDGSGARVFTFES